MLSQNLIIVLSIGSALLSLLLAVNAFFIRQLVSSLAQVEKGLAVLMEKHNGTSDRIKVSETSIEKLDDEIVQMRKRLHKVGNDLNQITLRLELTCGKVK